MGMDVLCQAKSGMGKTAVFVLAVLQQLEPQEGQVSALVLCHTRELAYQVRSGRHNSSAQQLGTTTRSQIAAEFKRFSVYLPNVAVGVYFGGVAIKTHRDELKAKVPPIVVGTPGRIKQVHAMKRANIVHHDPIAAGQGKGAQVGPLAPLYPGRV